MDLLGCSCASFAAPWVSETCGASCGRLACHKQASNQASKPASDKASKQAGKQAGRQASRQAGKQASKQPEGQEYNGSVHRKAQGTKTSRVPKGPKTFFSEGIHPKSYDEVWLKSVPEKVYRTFQFFGSLGIQLWLGLCHTETACSYRSQTDTLRVVGL